ncbi:unnamed protein product [Ilex paraguariensis]|uniref:RING-type E3 ubiquitin transferase n=1 Tax=Ilex paraguariensis TaxID=185542 RepID=A0ABC8UP20_9AQUA
MGLPQSPSPPHLYPHSLQLKLYQAFIFSIPILFSIILVLLFYLFYLKRRASSFSAHPSILPRTINHATQFIPSPCQMGLKGELKDKLPTVLFDEDLETRGSVCCVCLGEFEMKEELVQVPWCKHIFHMDCINHWLCWNSTCPLCRCPITTAGTKPSPPESVPSQPNLQQESNNQPTVILEQPQRQGQQNRSQEQQVIIMELSTTSTGSRQHHEMSGHLDPESIVIHIQTHSS